MSVYHFPNWISHPFHCTTGKQRTEFSNTLFLLHINPHPYFTSLPTIEHLTSSFPSVSQPPSFSAFWSSSSQKLLFSPIYFRIYYNFGSPEDLVSPLVFISILYFALFHPRVIKYLSHHGSKLEWARLYFGINETHQWLYAPRDVDAYFKIQESTIISLINFHLPSSFDCTSIFQSLSYKVSSATKVLLFSSQSSRNLT